MSIFWIVLLLIIVFLSHLLYTRYVPVKGIPCVEFDKNRNREKLTLDIRDYQEADNDKVEEALVIPIPYLRRYYHEIPSRFVHIVASNHVEKNLAIRFLKNKGFEITGYTLTECKCKKKIGKLA
ncbi:hypothetical protein SAMN04487943_101435 [Gracilibacillus orientalis]|uniref:Sulfurtransferase n=1 Tax=Gracilibacillus orientalis TaxID=334253 RepID=A0A1I4HH32_9BACI|nr:hypothetical protein [Gracilibacillus orientalis]SFL41492.1 hypothetical protein SAMN04487943_101435 [Gracilibacillus orientalis]